MKLVVNFKEADSGLVSVVGGKGHNLIVLTAAGFPVPPGFVVTAEAYGLFLAQVVDLESAQVEFNYDSPDILRGQCEALCANVEQITLPDPVARAIEAALAALPDDAYFAVRSSSTFEDLAQAAFAGQHDTYLNVRGLPQILDKVRDCFVSLWQDRAVLYRHRQGFTQRDARMAVVVQRQIACDALASAFPSIR